jgi:hypothetical protein
MSERGVRAVGRERADGIYSQAGASRAEVSLKGSAASGFVGTMVLGVNPKAAPAAV